MVCCSRTFEGLAVSKEYIVIETKKGSEFPFLLARLPKKALALCIHLSIEVVQSLFDRIVFQIHKIY